MTEAMVSHERWMRHYCLALADAGVSPADAGISALAGWHLQAIDQACFPDVALRAPVNFCVQRPGEDPGRYRFASFASSPECYLMYPMQMVDKLKLRCNAAAQEANASREATRAIVSLAAHEVRHRVQHRLRYVRLYETGFPPRDPFARASFESAITAFDGDSPDAVREFDARVVEELVYDRFAELRSPEMVSAIVLAGAAT